MFCTNCGSQLADGSKFCPYCSTPVAARPQQTQPQPQVRYPQEQSQYGYSQNQNPNSYPQPQGQDPYGYRSVPVQPEVSIDPMGDARGMKWFKFIIYFQLFANAVLNVINAIRLLTGVQYGDNASLVYTYFPSLKTADILFGICCLALAGFAIFTRHRLAKFFRNGPMLYYILMAASVVLSLIYLIMASSALHVSLGEVMDASTIASMLTSLVMLIVNWVYFNKRADLFTH